MESKGLLQRTYGGINAVNLKEIYPISAYNKDVIYITISLVGYYTAENLPEEVSIYSIDKFRYSCRSVTEKINISVIL